MEQSFLSFAVQRIKPSATFAMIRKEKELRAQGMHVIGLAAGEPDFDTPDHIKDAAIAAIRRGETKYTPVEGIAELRSAVCFKLKRENGLHYEPSQVCISNGGKQVIFNALAATINTGDEVIIPTPYWVSYPDMVEFFGGKPVFVASSEARQFKIMPEDIEKAITPRTKWLIFNSPSNPSGAVYSAADIKALAHVLLKHPHVRILSDDIYEHLIFDGLSFAHMVTVEPALASRTLLVNGLAKAYSMTGWRIGYGIGDGALIGAMIKVQGQSTSNACSISQHAAVEALMGTQEHIALFRQSFQERRDYILGRLHAIKGMTCNKPLGAFYVYPSCGAFLGKKTKSGVLLHTDQDFVENLLLEEGVAAVHGGAFGLSPFFRISYATSMENLKGACDRIERFCASLH